MSRIASSDELEVCEEVGRGGFGTVYRGIVTATGMEVAVKQIDLEHESADFVEVYREIQILSECRSPHITGYLGCFVKNHTLWVVMEYVDGGSLFEVLRPGPVEDESTVAAIAHGVLSALDYLHAQGKIHRDLKSQNILLSRAGGVKLTDFGVSTQLYSNFSRRNTTVGTPYWMAPEVIVSTSGHSYKADVWSLGCCVFELRNGKPPLQEHFSPMQALRKISSCTTDGDFLSLLGLQSRGWSRELVDFLQRCLVVDPADRSSASALLRHPFIAGHCTAENDAAARTRVRKLITRKRVWDQQHHEFKSHRYYAPTEIANNQRKWQGEPEVVQFDLSTIKTARGRGGAGREQDKEAPVRAELRRVLDRVFAKLESRAQLSTAQYDQTVALNDALLAAFVPLHCNEVTVLKKTLVCQYLRYLLRELSKPATEAARLSLQRSILPSSLAPEVRRRDPATAMDEIERSLLASWLDKMHA